MRNLELIDGHSVDVISFDEYNQTEGVLPLKNGDRVEIAAATLSKDGWEGKAGEIAGITAGSVFIRLPSHFRSIEHARGEEIFFAPNSKNYPA